jgi:hypothetical protein
VSGQTSGHVPPTVVLPDRVDVVNVGLPLFAEAVAEQGRPSIQVDWRIPAGGDAEAVAALRRLSGPLTGSVDEANAEVIRRLDGGRPHLVGVGPAASVVPGLEPRTLLHCGPAIGYADAPDPLRRSMHAATVAEGWAAGVEAAARMLADGEVRLSPANAHDVAVPMATAIGPSSPVLVTELEEGVRVFTPISQGSGDVAWFGRDTPAAIERLVFLREAVQPVLAEVLQASGPVDVMPIAAQAVAMGDDVHVRTQAATNLLIRHLLPFIADASSPGRVDVARFLSQNHLFFLTIAMGAARALTGWAAQVRGSSVVVGMSRNGTSFGVRLAGSDAWHLDAAPPVERALYNPGRGPADAAADIGDSAVLELVGLGAAAAAGSPAVAQLLGGPMAGALHLTEQLERICLARSSRITLPTLGGRGTPLGVDVRLAVELSATPQITTGILHRSDGSGQIGAGVAQAPIGAFRSALLALDAELSGTGAG